MAGHFLETDIRPVLDLQAGRMRHQFMEILEARAREVETGKLRLKVPRSEHLMERRQAMHFHFKPEVFIQLHGTTEFTFPAEKLTLHPGEMAIIPKGLPHGESVYPDSQPFRNVVIGFYSHTVSMHFAYEAKPHTPDIESIEFYETPDLRKLTELVDYLAQKTYVPPGPGHHWLLKGALMTFLGALLNLIHHDTPETGKDSSRVFQVKWVVREHLFNPKLNVKMLADKLHCSADYLSHVFHKDTKETLIHYINRQRILGASDALANTSLSVSEIAWACGFSDAGYFTRVFKKFTGKTPNVFRQDALTAASVIEHQPKTIYSDREDFSPGKPHKPAKTASVK